MTQGYKYVARTLAKDYRQRLNCKKIEPIFATDVILVSILHR